MKLRRRVLLGVGLLASLGACSASRTALRAASERSGTGFLDGAERSFVVVGYSTSYVWPRMLQDMLDEHAGGRRLYHVLNAVVGGAPVETWIAPPGSADYRRSVRPMVWDFFGDDARLRGGAPPPTVALCQQSLQLTRSERGPVSSEHDMVGAEMGADALEKLAFRLRDIGVEDVVIATHIYKEPVEPEVENERIALARLLARGHDFIHAGPDVWTPTRDGFPGCYEADRLHPNEEGMKIMAAAWYRALAGRAARPEVVDHMRARSYDVRALTREYIDWRRRDGA